MHYQKLWHLFQVTLKKSLKDQFYAPLKDSLLTLLNVPANINPLALFSAS